MGGGRMVRQWVRASRWMAEGLVEMVRNVLCCYHMR